MCSRKDYVAVARRINSMHDAPLHKDIALSVDFKEGYDQAVRGFTFRMAEFFASDNPNFDRSRFLKACGIEE